MAKKPIDYLGICLLIALAVFFAAIASSLDGESIRLHYLVIMITAMFIMYYTDNIN